MPIQRDRQPEGEQYKGVIGADFPKHPSSIPPLPAYPNLKRELRSWQAALILTYLEIYFPGQQDSNGHWIDPPIPMRLDDLCEVMQAGRRTLYTALCILCSRFVNEDARLRAARGAREFINPIHIRHRATKLYSMTGPFSHRHDVDLVFRRNRGQIAATLKAAGIITLGQPDAIPGTQDDRRYTVIEPSGDTVQTPSRSEAIQALLRDSVLVGDRRGGRWERVKRAEKGQNAGKRGFIPDA
jgi:hypothetical protein